MKKHYYVGDFETTVYKGQESTEVWAAAFVPLFSEDVVVVNSIRKAWQYLLSLPDKTICYFHNLKFDGAFWLDFFLVQNDFQQAFSNGKFIEEKDMPSHSVRYTISDMGQWYAIVVKEGNKVVEFRDSLKLLPFSVKEIGKSFGTKHKKSEIEYVGYRKADGDISDVERQYIANDVLVVKEALETMFTEGHNKLTIGACCLNEYINIIGKPVYDKRYPDLYKMKIDDAYDAPSVGDYVHKSYRGGWCYVVKGKEGLHYNGCTCDVNSLYPSMMHSKSCNRYPTGTPHFWRGNYIPSAALKVGVYYFVRIRTQFYIKDGYLPFVQIKNNLLYKSTESLTTSDVYNKNDGKYYSKYIDANGNVVDAKVTITLTMTDFALLQEHYHLVNCEILDGCYFAAQIGIFDTYIDKYRKLKQESTGAKRQMAKLFLNNLYGKMAASPISDFKVAVIDQGVVNFVDKCADEKKPGYIPIGAAITSYAREFTIRAAQKNYYGVDKPGFIYADTDSIHCDLTPNSIKGVRIHDKDFCCWKVESEWSEGVFTRQKTYIEKEKNGEYIVRCAGMPVKCKNLFIASVTGHYDEEGLSDIELEFVQKKRELQDFKIGLSVPGKLLPKRIKGGVVLQDTTYVMR